MSGSVSSYLYFVIFETCGTLFRESLVEIKCRFGSSSLDASADAKSERNDVEIYQIKSFQQKV